MPRRRQKAFRFLALGEHQAETYAAERQEDIPAAAYEGLQATGDLETIIAERDTVQRCMEQLPETLRLPLLLSIVAGFSQRVLAGMLALNEATVGQRLSRALKDFQRLYAHDR